MNVQYGSGWDAPLTWANFDASPTLRLEKLPLFKRIYVKNESPFPKNVRYGNIVSGLPLADATCGLLYCSHVLEHLSRNDFHQALRESFRVLRPGGVWRLVMPDLKLEAEKYLRSRDPNASTDFLIQTGLGQISRPKSLGQRLTEAFGNSKHLWLWDYNSTYSALENAGFIQIRPAKLGDSEHPAFVEVERASRWKDALAIECRRAL